MAAARYQISGLGKAFIAVLAAITVSGCSVVTRDFKPGDVEIRARRDLQALYTAQEPIGTQFTLEGAVARGLQYNLDYRVSRIEQQIALGEVDLAKSGFLPELSASVSYLNRSNDAGGRSQSLLTGEESLEPSSSVERNRDTASLKMVWNLLDFGVSYLAVKQRQDQARVAYQLRRQARNRLVGDIVEAYYSAWLAERYEGVIRSLSRQVDGQLENYRALADKDIEKVTAYRRQSQLIELRSRLRALVKDFASSRSSLARLINAPVTRIPPLQPPYRLAGVTEALAPVETMEGMALRKRPELHISEYRERISQVEVRKSLLRLLPGLELNTGYSRDSNQFLYNSSWVDSGVRLGWNLINLGARVQERKKAKSEVELARIRRLSSTVGVLSQVHIAIAKHHVAREEFADRAQQRDVLEKLLTSISVVPESVTPFEYIKASANTLVSSIQADIAAMDLELARYDVLLSVGEDLVEQPENSAAESRANAAEIARRLEQLMSTYFGIVPRA